MTNYNKMRSRLAIAKGEVLKKERSGSYKFGYTMRALNVKEKVDSQWEWYFKMRQSNG